MLENRNTRQSPWSCTVLMIARHRSVWIPLWLILLASLWPSGLASATASPLKDLGPAPAFTLDTHGGKRVSLADYLDHGPVIIEFWATWCKPCRKEMPHLQALYERYLEQGLSVLAISQDDPRSQPKIGAFLRSQKLTFPILLDGDSRISRLFRVSAVPTTFLVSTEGRIVALHRGYRDGDERILEQEVRELLASEPAAVTP